MRTRSCARRPFPYRPLAVAAAIALLLGASLPARADVTATGSYFVYPIAVPLGPGSTDIGANSLVVGNITAGSFSVTAGSLFSGASIGFGTGVTGVGTGLFDGSGTVVTLNGDGNSNRFGVGEWGTGNVTVSGGATLNGRANASACLLGNGWCNNFIGNAAGSDATFTATGANSSASFLQAFVVGGVSVFTQAGSGFDFGTPGGSTTGRVNVLAGGTLTTDGATLGMGPGGNNPLGTERSTAVVVVDGTGSVWRVTGGSLPGAYSAAFVGTATGANATATIDITNGGRMVFNGTVAANGDTDGLNLTSNGVSTAMKIDGTGSQLIFGGEGGFLQVGRRGSGTATLDVQNGGMASGIQSLQVGRDGTTGTLTVAGVGSEVLVNGFAPATATGGVANAYTVIGRNGGSGTVNVTDTGKLTIVGQRGNTPNGTALDLGRDSTSTGTLNISGAGSVVSISQASVVSGGGSAEANNPLVRIGREGVGTLNITNGGKLLIDGQAVSTVADTRTTQLRIGGNNDTSIGGTGVALVSGIGSEIRLTGSDTIVFVGRGAQSIGTLNVENGGSVSSNGMIVGSAGGTGIVNVNNARLNFSGQQTGDQLAGAFLVVGRNTGSNGTVNLTNGSVVDVSNAGSAGAGISVGGTQFRPFGNGAFNATDSTVNVTAATAQALFRVGRDDTVTATATFTNSTLNVSGATADSSRVIIAQLPGSTGTLTLNAGSVLNAGYVGVGATPTGLLPGTYTPQNLGGTGRLILNNSTVYTTTFELGAGGTLSGNGGVINATGDVIIGGTIDPGNSPGSLRINCNLISLDGSKLILEIKDKDNGPGYDIDQLIIGRDSTFDLKELEVVFSFLGNTDPEAFADSGGLDLDNFLRAGRLVGDGDDPLSALFASGQTWADVLDLNMITAESSVFDITSISFNSDGSVQEMISAPIPEPSTWTLMLLGFLFVAGSRARTLRRGPIALTHGGPVAACS